MRKYGLKLQKHYLYRKEIETIKIFSFIEDFTNIHRPFLLVNLITKKIWVDFSN